jgi:RNA polymerase-binding transcription factor DksA
LTRINAAVGAAPYDGPTLNEVAMTAPDPLETARIRRLIERRLDALRGEIADKLGDAALVQASLDHAGDSGDQSVADDTATADFADARRDIDEYQAGRVALTRLESGDYGTCSECGEPIPAARLAAQPFAIRCIGCQERAERAAGRHRSSM